MDVRPSEVVAEDSALGIGAACIDRSSTVHLNSSLTSYDHALRHS